MSPRPRRLNDDEREALETEAAMRATVTGVSPDWADDKPTDTPDRTRSPQLATDYVYATHPDTGLDVVFIPGEALPAWAIASTD